MKKTTENYPRVETVNGVRRLYVHFLDLVGMRVPASRRQALKQIRRARRVCYTVNG